MLRLRWVYDLAYQLSQASTRVELCLTIYEVFDNPIPELYDILRHRALLCEMI